MVNQSDIGSTSNSFGKKYTKIDVLSWVDLFLVSILAPGMTSDTISKKGNCCASQYLTSIFSVILGKGPQSAVVSSNKQCIYNQTFSFTIAYIPTSGHSTVAINKRQTLIMNIYALPRPSGAILSRDSLYRRRMRASPEYISAQNEWDGCEEIVTRLWR